MFTSQRGIQKQELVEAETTYAVVFVPVHLVVKGEEVKVPPAAGRRDDSTGTVGGGNVRLPVLDISKIKVIGSNLTLNSNEPCPTRKKKKTNLKLSRYFVVIFTL